jgi:cytochrome c
MAWHPLRVTLACLTAAVALSLLPPVIGSAAAAGDPAAGKTVFQSNCSICHSPQAGRNMIGPTLFGVVGRATGAVPGYSYSTGNKDAHLTWDEATLDKYLESPRTVVPGTKMTYAGLKDPTKRADLIAYLATLK